MIVVLGRPRVYRPEPGWGRVLLAVLAASAAMVIALLWQYGNLSTWVDAVASSRASRLTLLIVLGIVVYGVTLVAAGLRRHHLEKGAS